MTNPTAPFKFSDFDRLVVVPAGLQTKSSLLHHLAEKLEFPEHFGFNWDALADCLDDLSWLPSGRVYLLHEDLPLADDSEAAAKYLDILADALAALEPDDPDRLTVVFPQKIRDAALHALELGRSGSR